MARRGKLTDFQRALSERLAQAATRKVSSSNRLGVSTGQRQWLLRLDQAGEVLFAPELHTVPLTKSWFRGVANIRGHLVSVTDWSEFCGGAPAALNYRSRMVLLSERLGMPAALLVGTVGALDGGIVQGCGRSHLGRSGPHATHLRRVVSACCSDLANTKIVRRKCPSM